ncbi:hypothetical protein STRTUCAR8_01391 [Streptomyces turgidiscabies Car8]|uniref:Uncharacterized protein n=1 Tax=Streptomyces turgidiscabies (strain Car8) TaxID=698760 RepID=L7F4U8_STRT8|nr:hypothetical protein STRTUCAR8_01391 [Streptomyces turgidiscabies Car8]
MRAWAAETKAPDGSYVLDDPSVRQALARRHARIVRHRAVDPPGAAVETGMEAGRRTGAPIQP